MAIQFVVETGTGLSTATSYISLADAKQEWDNLGYDYSALSDDQLSVLLNSATKTIDGQYFNKFKGCRSSSDQALQWPRADAYYPDGYYIGSTTIPKELERATSEMAYADNAGTTIQPVNSSAGNVVKESSRVDVISESKEYAEGSFRSHPRIPAVDDALRPLLGSTGGYGARPVVRV